jgi:transposase, IS5 family
VTFIGGYDDILFAIPMNQAKLSCLKRAYGLARCTWRGLNHFKAYVWSSVVAYNLVVFVRLRSA